jgi:ketosteroid isomerase-like protein
MASNAAIARHDIDGIAKYWLPDFVQTIGRGTSLTGKDTIIAAWKQLFKTNPAVLYIRTPVTITVGDNGIMAWETGTGKRKTHTAKAAIIRLCGERSTASGNCRLSCLCR